ncbi:MAG: tRNA (adenosine(37)-N6)-threonylcarbamoyltransferase complex ATPase subunit type 1 TsaE [bacterium]
MNPPLLCLCASAADTRAHAAAWSQAAQPGTIFLLEGDLGAGKTEWVKGLAEGVGYHGEVTSPTFTLVHEYRGGRLPIFHWDLYRLGVKTDWDALELNQHINEQGIVVVEWPERYPHAWPKGAVRVRIRILPSEEREITWAAVQ